MKLQKVAGATSEIWQIFIADSSSTTGAGLAGLAVGGTIPTAYYHRDTDTTATAMTLVTMTVGTFTSLGFKEIDATHMAGWYQFCPPNAALASGAKSVAFHFYGATNQAPLPIEVQLTAVNPDSATAFITSVATVTTVTNQLTAAAIATGVWQDATAGDFTAANSVGKSVMNGVSLGTGLTVAAVSGAVGSVTGAVGSVTGLTASDVGAIKTQTDKLTFTVANQVDSNVLDWKSATAPAMTGDAFARIGASGAGLTAVALTSAYDAAKTASQAGDVMKVSSGTGANQISLSSGLVTVGTLNAGVIDAASLATAAKDAISANVFARAFSASYGSYTFDQLTSMMASALLGKASGLATTTATFRNLADSANVIVATVDSNGNRTAVSLTP